VIATGAARADEPPARSLALDAADAMQRPARADEPHYFKCLEPNRRVVIQLVGEAE
jgi:hypothetical protein